MKKETAQTDELPGAKYCFRNTNAGTGEIYDSTGKLLWRYRPPASIPNILNGFRGPNFILNDHEDREVLRIERTKTFPRASFVLVEGGSPRARVEKAGVLSFKYTVALSSGPKWTFEIPMFTVNFKGESEKGARVRVRLASELMWYVLIDEGEDSRELVSVLAFLHSERCRT